MNVLPQVCGSGTPSDFYYTLLWAYTGGFMARCAADAQALGRKLSKSHFWSETFICPETQRETQVEV